MNVALNVWRVVSWFLPRREIALPRNILVFQKTPPEEYLRKLIKAFQEVYSAPPWDEDWSPKRVQEKLHQELLGGVLVLLMGKNQRRVTGFSWGAIISPEGVIPRVAASFPKQPKEATQGLKEKLIPLLPPHFFYWDEIALCPEARGGIEPIRRLTLPLLKFARDEGVKSVLFRTTPEAKIVSLTRLLGFQPIFRRKVKGLKEMYLYLSDLRPILRFAQHANAHQVGKIMRILSRTPRARSS